MSHPIKSDIRARIAVDLTCRCCGRHVVLGITPSDFWDWKQGKFIQDAMPYLNAGEREMLMSRTCNECFDEMFGDE